MEIRDDDAVLRADLHDETADELIEVKASVDRETIRLALGQILDYAHIVAPRTRTILVPEELPAGLIGLLHANNVDVVWRSGEGRFELSRCPQEDS